MRHRSEFPRRTLDPVGGRILEEFQFCVLPLGEEVVIPRGTIYNCLASLGCFLRWRMRDLWLPVLISSPLTARRLF